MRMELDALDHLTASAFRATSSARTWYAASRGNIPVPTYVAEFLLGRYCASTDDAEIEEGLRIVEMQMRERAVRSGEEEWFKARARDHGFVKLIDLVSARLETRTDSYLVTLPSLQLDDVRIDRRSGRVERASAHRGFLRRSHARV